MEIQLSAKVLSGIFMLLAFITSFSCVTILTNLTESKKLWKLIAIPLGIMAIICFIAGVHFCEISDELTKNKRLSERLSKLPSAWVDLYKQVEAKDERVRKYYIDKILTEHQNLFQECKFEQLEVFDNFGEEVMSSVLPFATDLKGFSLNKEGTANE